jgi:hypothetical protein
LEFKHDVTLHLGKREPYWLITKPGLVKKRIAKPGNL